MIYIIAEIGVNHNGSYRTAKKMMKQAKDCGANAVKFQNFNPDEITLRNVKKVDYQMQQTNVKETQHQLLQKLTLTKEEFRKLKAYAKNISIDYISTPFDDENIDFLLNDLRLRTIKISSTDTDNLPMLLKLGKSNKKIIISTGMSNIDDVDLALSALAFGNKENRKNFNISRDLNYYKKNLSYLKKKVTLMHCTTEYPAPLEELNMNVINTFLERYQINIGYSDHSCCKITPIIAAAKGVSMIEVHVTQDNNNDGPDHHSSLNFKNFRDYVKNIRQAEIINGSFDKALTKSERKNKLKVRKSLILNNKLPVGKKILESDLSCLRPGNGISPKYFYAVIGKTLKKSYKRNTVIKKSMLKKKL